MEPREAIHYHASGKVAWELGDTLAVFRGGVSRAGVRSQLTTRSVIALAKSEAMVKWARAQLPLKHDNRMLFRRDRHLCAYCGGQFDRRELTRDHIMPLSRNGADTWKNVVTAEGFNPPHSSRLRANNDLETERQTVRLVSEARRRLCICLR